MSDERRERYPGATLDESIGWRDSQVAWQKIHTRRRRIMFWGALLAFAGGITLTWLVHVHMHLH